MHQIFTIMKKYLLSAIIPVIGLLSVAILMNSCSKSSDDNKIITDPPMTSIAKIIYRRADTALTASELWSVKSDGTDNHKIPVSLPAGWSFDNDIAAIISPDSKTLALGLLNDNIGKSAIYTCNIDGSNVHPALTLNDNVLMYLQDFINPSTVLYWKTNEGTDNDELWSINTDGSSNQKINITLPADNRFGDGKFAKVTSDGKTIIFSTFNTLTLASGSIYKCNIDGSNLTLITTENTTSFSIQSLVNNTTILYRKPNSTTFATELWSVNVDGTNKHQLSVSLPSGLSLGDQGVAKVLNNVLYLSTTTAGINDRYGQEAIYMAGIDGSNVKLVTQIPLGYTIAPQAIQQ